MNRLKMGIAGALALVWCALASGPARSAESDSAAVTPVGTGPSYTVEATASVHVVQGAYFGAPPANSSWSEGFTRLRFNYGLPTGVWFSAGGVIQGTAGEDYFGVENVGDGRVDQLVVGASHIGGSGVSIAAGRQDVVLGDGFLIGDGYRDTKAALWNIPLNYFDAVKADWKQGPLHAVAFGANLSPSMGGTGDETKGQVLGGELGWSPAADADVAFACLQRIDTGPTDLDASAASLRGTYTRGFTTLSGEAVLEGGTQADVTLAGRGGHVGLVLAPEARLSPTLGVEYFLFSGDDSTTTKDESYYPWMYRWSDWSRYYVGDLLSSTAGTASDMRIWLVQAGITPREGTGVRLLAHRMDLDTGSSYGLESGHSKAFAYEYDLVIDQSIGERWSAWIMGAYATPLDAAKAHLGTEASSQVFGSVTFKFGGPGGD